MAKLSEYLSVSKAADYLGVSADSLRRWDRAGKLSARRHPVSGYRLYLPAELDAFLKTLEAAPKSPKNPRHESEMV